MTDLIDCQIKLNKVTAAAFGILRVRFQAVRGYIMV